MEIDLMEGTKALAALSPGYYEIGFY